MSNNEAIGYALYKNLLTRGNKTGLTNTAGHPAPSAASSRTPDARTITQTRNNQRIRPSAQLVAQSSAQLVDQPHSSSEATLGSAEQNSNRGLAEHRPIELRSPAKAKKVSNRDLLGFILKLDDNLKKANSDSKSDEKSDRTQDTPLNGANNSDTEYESADEESDHDLSDNSTDVSSSEASSDDNDEDYVSSDISSEGYSSSEEEENSSIDIHDSLNHSGDQVPVTKSQNARLKKLRAHRSRTQNPHLKKLYETKAARLKRLLRLKRPLRLFSSQTRTRNKGDLFKLFLSAPEANANDNKEVKRAQSAASSGANNKMLGLFGVSQLTPNNGSDQSHTSTSTMPITPDRKETELKSTPFGYKTPQNDIPSPIPNKDELRSFPQTPLGSAQPNIFEIRKASQNSTPTSSTGSKNSSNDGSPESSPTIELFGDGSSLKDSSRQNLGNQFSEVETATDEPDNPTTQKAPSPATPEEQNQTGRATPLTSKSKKSVNFPKNFEERREFTIDNSDNGIKKSTNNDTSDPMQSLIDSTSNSSSINSSTQEKFRVFNNLLNKQGSPAKSQTNSAATPTQIEQTTVTATMAAATMAAATATNLPIPQPTTRSLLGNQDAPKTPVATSVPHPQTPPTQPETVAVDVANIQETFSSIGDVVTRLGEQAIILDKRLRADDIPETINSIKDEFHVKNVEIIFGITDSNSAFKAFSMKVIEEDNEHKVQIRPFSNPKKEADCALFVLNKVYNNLSVGRVVKELLHSFSLEEENVNKDFDDEILGQTIQTFNTPAKTPTRSGQKKRASKTPKKN